VGDDVMSDEASFMKCAFCEWKTPRWITTKRGKKSNGGKRLLTHIETAHHDDYMRIMKTVNAYKRMEEEFPL
jgi:hypothetical protein